MTGSPNSLSLLLYVVASVWHSLSCLVSRRTSFATSCDLLRSVWAANPATAIFSESSLSWNVFWSARRFFWNLSSSDSRLASVASICSWILWGQPMQVHLIEKTVILLLSNAPVMRSRYILSFHATKLNKIRFCDTQKYRFLQRERNLVLKFT